MRFKVILAVTLGIFLVSVPLFARPDFQKVNVRVNVDDLNSVNSRLPIGIFPAGITSSPGDTVGTTFYEYQTNGVTGNRVVRDSLNGIHFCWMNKLSNGDRHVYYNFVDESGQWTAGQTGTAVSSVAGAGYTNMDIFSDNTAAVAYHNGANLFLTLGVDAIRGGGLFTLYDPPEVYPGYPEAYWPYITVDNQGFIHLTARINGSTSDQDLSLYTRSEDGGATWTSLAVVDTTHQITCFPVSSPVSNKVAIVYSKNFPGDATIYLGDVLYTESADGQTWNFGHPINITNYQYSDTLRAWLDLDAVYDFNDNLHIIWNSGVYDADNDALYVSSFLFHWSEATGISMIADGYWNAYTGAANLTLSKPSIGVDDDNNLYVIWTQFDSTDVSAGGFSNGEIYAAASGDGGATWGTPVNLTNSHTEGCLPGDCDSDHWSSLCEYVDDYLHILYINDKDAGAYIQGEGAETENPVLYLKVPKGIVGVGEEANEPTSFKLYGNYPNPFNASTNIEFSLEKPSKVTLEVYNVLGRKVATLLDNTMNSGEHTINWNASSMPSGIYFYKLSANGETMTRRMTLLK